MTNVVQVDPLAPFARRATKHEWSESVPTQALQNMSPEQAAKLGATLPAAAATTSSSKSKEDPSSSSSAAAGGFGGYNPIRRFIVNGCLVSLFGDKRLLLMGGAVSGETTNQVAEYDALVTKQWSHGLPMPERRSEGTAAVLYVAPPPPPKQEGGGADSSSSSPLSQTAALNATNMKGASADQKAAATAAALAANSPQQLVVLFGGFDDVNVMNDTSFFLVNGAPPTSSDQKVSGKWWRLAPSSVQPPPRRGHSMTSMVDSTGCQVPSGALPGTTASLAAFQTIRYSTSVFVFGGFDGRKRLGDLWELSVPYGCNQPASPTVPAATTTVADGLHWKKLSVTGFQPAPRDGATLTSDPAHKRLMLFGGYTTRRENDCYALDTETHCWTKWSLAPSPSPRFGAMAAVSGNFAVYGLGQDAKGPSNALFQLVIPPPPPSSSSSNNNTNNTVSAPSSPAGKEKDNNNEQQQQQQQQPKWAMCPLEGEVEVDNRIDFSWTVTPELGPLLSLTQAPEGKQGKQSAAAEKAASAAGGDSARDGANQLQQKKTLWIFGGSNEKSYSTSLVEIELDRVETQQKGGRR